MADFRAALVKELQFFLLFRRRLAAYLAGTANPVFKRDDKGRLVNRELLVLRGMSIVKRPLPERNVSADKVQ